MSGSTEDGSSSSSFHRTPSNQIIKIGSDFTLRCHHDATASVYTVKKPGPRRGQQFYCCPVWKTADCGFMVWEKDMQEIVRELMKRSGNSPPTIEETDLVHLREENKRLLEKNAKMKKKIQKYEDELKIMQQGNANTRLFFVLLCMVVVVFGLLMK